MKSFLELEGLHVFVTGAAGGIGSAIVEEFLGTCNGLHQNSQQLSIYIIVSFLIPHVVVHG
jgi:nucleoside-diphosphate-sugar epimerase